MLLDIKFFLIIFNKHIFKQTLDFFDIINIFLIESEIVNWIVQLLNFKKMFSKKNLVRFREDRAKTFLRSLGWDEKYPIPMKWSFHENDKGDLSGVGLFCIDGEGILWVKNAVSAINLYMKCYDLVTAEEILSKREPLKKALKKKWELCYHLMLKAYAVRFSDRIFQLKIENQK